MREDPVGYPITYDTVGRFVVTRLVDGQVLGVYDDRDEAIDAALADRSTCR